ncbi:hypothetical protein [Parachlamydia sp. AcF125]|uniref:hypothetical protein n=1 Tax=Parachlamydia sp. AcF125 TaxID=2795736 RepID=UPI001BC96B02|nr:hypothetical protein [Parachlamydia sp. AcF125]MBS4168767.1 hypothetical protein [Parachlamydia sp. AcF125]
MATFNYGDYKFNAIYPKKNCREANYRQDLDKFSKRKLFGSLIVKKDGTLQEVGFFKSLFYFFYRDMKKLVRLRALHFIAYGKQEGALSPDRLKKIEDLAKRVGINQNKKDNRNFQNLIKATEKEKIDKAVENFYLSHKKEYKSLESKNKWIHGYDQNSKGKGGTPGAASEKAGNPSPDIPPSGPQSHIHDPTQRAEEEDEPNDTGSSSFSSSGTDSSTLIGEEDEASHKEGKDLAAGEDTQSGSSSQGSEPSLPERHFRRSKSSEDLRHAPFLKQQPYEPLSMRALNLNPYVRSKPAAGMAEQPVEDASSPTPRETEQDQTPQLMSTSSTEVPPTIKVEKRDLRQEWSEGQILTEISARLKELEETFYLEDRVIREKFSEIVTLIKERKSPILFFKVYELLNPYETPQINVSEYIKHLANECLQSAGQLSYLPALVELFMLEKKKREELMQGNFMDLQAFMQSNNGSDLDDYAERILNSEDSKAIYEIGKMYAKEKVVLAAPSKDSLQEAKRWYARAAELNHPAAMLHLSSLYLCEGQKGRATEIIKKLKTEITQEDFSALTGESEEILALLKAFKKEKHFSIYQGLGFPIEVLAGPEPVDEVPPPPPLSPAPSPVSQVPPAPAFLNKGKPAASRQTMEADQQLREAIFRRANPQLEQEADERERKINEKIKAEKQAKEEENARLEALSAEQRAKLAAQQEELKQQEEKFAKNKEESGQHLLERVLKRRADLRIDASLLEESLTEQDLSSSRSLSSSIVEETLNVVSPFLNNQAFLDEGRALDQFTPLVVNSFKELKENFEQFEKTLNTKQRNEKKLQGEGIALWRSLGSFEEKLPTLKKYLDSQDVLKNKMAELVEKSNQLKKNQEKLLSNLARLERLAKELEEAGSKKGTKKTSFIDEIKNLMKESKINFDQPSQIPSRFMEEGSLERSTFWDESDDDEDLSEWQRM